MDKENRDPNEPTEKEAIELKVMEIEEVENEDAISSSSSECNFEKQKRLLKEFEEIMKTLDITPIQTTEVKTEKCIKDQTNPAQPGKKVMVNVATQTDPNPDDYGAREDRARRRVNELKLRTPSEKILEQIAPRIPADKSDEKAKQVALAMIRVTENGGIFGRNRRIPGCFNCTGPHTHSNCPYRRGTFCGSCGERGMMLNNCPFCKGKQYGTEGKWRYV